MAFLLNLETATKNCSVSIAKDGITIAFRETAEQDYSHAEKLHIFIEQVLVESGLKIQDLDAIAVSRGPGSYTGLRIGVSAAKGLCYPLKIPLISVDTLQVLAAQASITDGLIVPMLDARRMEVYSAIYNSELNGVRDVKAEIITSESFSEYDEKLYFIGDCAEKCKPLLQKENFIFLEDFVFPSAREMSRLSFEKFTNNDFVDLAYFEPFYLKDFMMATAKK